MQEDLWTSDLKSSSYEGLKRSRSEYTESGRKDEAEFRAAAERLHNVANNALRVVGTPVMNGISAILSPDLPGSSVNPDIDKYKDKNGKIQQHFHGLDNLRDDPNHLHEKGWKRPKDQAAPSGYADDYGRTNTVYRSIKKGPDWSGGGDRAHASVLPGVVAQAMDAHNGFDSLKLGGFTV